MKYSEAQINAACELRERGLTYVEISRRTGMHKSSVLEYCQERGAVSLRSKAGNAVSFSPEEEALIERMRAEGIRVAQIARELGRDNKTIRNRLRGIAYRQAVVEAQI